jgi:hypothetical protein
VKSNIKIPWRYHIKDAIEQAVLWLIAVPVVIAVFLLVGMFFYAIFSIFE